MTTAAEARKLAEETRLYTEQRFKAAIVIDEYATLLESMERPCEAVDEIDKDAVKLPYTRMKDLAKLLASQVEALKAERDQIAAETAAMRSAVYQALIISRHALNRWQLKYAEWSNSLPTAFDKRLPPSDHINALEDIDSALNSLSPKKEPRP